MGILTGDEYRQRVCDFYNEKAREYIKSMSYVEDVMGLGVDIEKCGEEVEGICGEMIGILEGKVGFES